MNENETEGGVVEVTVVDEFDEVNGFINVNTMLASLNLHSSGKPLLGGFGKDQVQRVDVKNVNAQRASKNIPYTELINKFAPLVKDLSKHHILGKILQGLIIKMKRILRDTNPSNLTSDFLDQARGVETGMNNLNDGFVFNFGGNLKISLMERL